MNVVDNGDYSNIIMKAVIVNNDTSTDPEGKSRVQIYIPQIHYEYASIYQAYMNAGDKTTTGHFDKFPWAVSVAEGLEIGNEVYVCNVNNKGDEYIVLGVEANETSNFNYSVNAAGGSGVDIYNTALGGVVEYAMPIIIHNEVGIDVNAWPTGIADDYYAKITPYDNGGWSVGLIQWHEARAYDILQYITTQDTEWSNRFYDKACDLYNDLASGSQTARLKYQSDYHPTPGDSIYNSIQALLAGSDIAKWAQRNFATQSVATDMGICVKAGVTNPGILIFMADLMNQYGANLPTTIRNAATYSNNRTAGSIGQFDSFVQSCKDNPSLHYDRYATRRGNTVAYIHNLFNQGLINAEGGASSVALDVTSTGYVQPGEQQIFLNGQNINNGVTYINTGYIFPLPNLTCSTAKVTNEHTTSNPSGSHCGMDFGITQGTPVLAVQSGTVILSTALKNQDGSYRSYGEYMKITHPDKNTSLYAHMQAGSRQFSTGQEVKQGDVIGYVGSTGNSTGPHLHFNIITSSGYYDNPRKYIP